SDASGFTPLSLTRRSALLVTREQVLHLLDRQRLYRALMARHGLGPEQRVVDRFLRGLENCTEQRRQALRRQDAPGARRVFAVADAHLRRGREGDRVVAAAVRVA